MIVRREDDVYAPFRQLVRDSGGIIRVGQDLSPVLKREQEAGVAVPFEGNRSRLAGHGFLRKDGERYPQPGKDCIKDEFHGEFSV